MTDPGILASTPLQANPDLSGASLNVSAPSATATPNSALNTTSISSTSIAPTTPISLPKAPTDSNNYAGMIAGGNATLGANTNTLAGATTPSGAVVDPKTGALISGPTNTNGASSDTSLSNLLQQYLSGSTPPPSASDSYNKLYNSSGIPGLQTNSNTDAASLKTAQANLDATNAKLAGITAQASAIPIQDQKDITGLVTTGGLATKTSAELRNNALQALPLQAQAIAQQAAVAAAQGNSTLSANLLTQAQDHLDKMFQIQSTDATNQYNYQQDQRKAVYDFATKAQQAQLDAQSKAADQAHTDLQAAIRNAQDLAKTAIANGQPDIAAKIAALDPNSNTYRTDLAALEGKMAPTPDLQFVAGTANQTSGYFNKATGKFTPSGGSTTPDGNAPVSTASGSNIIAGVKVDPTVANDVLAVLEGRNTLYNIHLNVGKTNIGAAYMRKMRTAITNVDPNFDFIGSDGGGKSVSTSFVQKATAAINTVLPNIQKIVDLSNQVDRIGITGVDALIQKGGLVVNNQKVANFHEAQKLIADEIGVALGAGTVSDMKLQLGFDITDPSVSQETFASNMGIVKSFLENRVNSLKSLRYSSATVNGVPGSSTSNGVVPNPSGATGTLVTAPDGTQVQITD